MKFEKQRIEYLKRRLSNHAQEYIICKEAGLIEEMIKEEEACELYEYKLKLLGVDIDNLD